MNTNILSLILNSKKKKIDILKKNREGIYALVKKVPKIRSFKSALQRENKISIIAEIKRASPSAGVIRKEFSPVELASSLESAGVSALSILTEEEFFLGKKTYIEDVRARVNIPLLRKDFILDELQVIEARGLGADAILLIMRILDEETFARLFRVAKDMGLDVLVEVSTQKELRKVLKYPVDIIGINNRNLNTMEVDVERTKELSPFIPSEIVKVGMSGISSLKDVLLFKGIGINAVLIGEAFMRESDPSEKARELNIDG